MSEGKFRYLLLLPIVLFVLVSCETGNGTRKKKEKPVSESIAVLAALPLEAPEPLDNPTNARKVELGKYLFYDPVLSGNRDVACATCHQAEFNYAEFLETSIGVNGTGSNSKRRFLTPNTIPFVKRNSQSILNTAFNGLTSHGHYDPKLAPMFWDSRAKSLEEQALLPIQTLEEMRGHSYSEEAILPEVIARIQRIPEYRQLFAEAFAGESNPVHIKNLAKALAAYERTLIANHTRFDLYMRGDSNALSLSEKDGLNLFLRTGCAKCHNGPMFSDFKLHALGVPDTQNRKESDVGINKDYAFRTPSLRNLRYTAPYMHSGKFATLDQVLMFYEDIAGGKIENPHVTPSQLDPLATELNLKFRDISGIVEFLNTLNDDNFDKTVPTRVPSGLKVKGNLD